MNVREAALVDYVKQSCKENEVKELTLKEAEDLFEKTLGNSNKPVLVRCVKEALNKAGVNIIEVKNFFKVLIGVKVSLGTEILEVKKTEKTVKEEKRLMEPMLHVDDDRFLCHYCGSKHEELDLLTNGHLICTPCKSEAMFNRLQIGK